MATAYHGLQTRLSRQLDRAEKLTSGADRYVDCGIELWVIEQDLESGAEVFPGAPPLVLLESEPRRIGGIYDTLVGEFVGPSENPLRWFTGRALADVITRPIDHAAKEPSRVILVAAEGAGKTRGAAQATVWRNVAMAERGIRGDWGVTAPVAKRLGHMREALVSIVPVSTHHKTIPGAWGWLDGEDNINLVFGRRLQLRSTKPHSKDTGSPIQGYNWDGSTDDELQDSIDLGADPNIEARLRATRHSERICTASVKDSSKFRDALAVKKASKNWRVKRLSYRDAQFIWPEHWENMKDGLSDREYRRRVLAEDVPPERQVYYSFERDRNIVEMPRKARDVTAQLLSRGNRVLVGYDPGATRHVALILKAYATPEQLRANTYTWFVVQELTEPQVTTRQFAAMLHTQLSDRYQVDIPGRSAGHAQIHSDKWVNTEVDEKHPDRTVYTEFRRRRLRISAAAYAQTKVNSGQAPKPGSVPLNASIEMINGLLFSARGEVRLAILKNRDGTHCAPELVKSLENAERSMDGRAHVKPKDKRFDLSDHPAALRYALWPLEKTRYLDRDVEMDVA